MWKEEEGQRKEERQKLGHLVEGAPYTTPSLELGPNGSVVKDGGGPSCHRAIVVVAKVVCCLPIFIATMPPQFMA